MSILAANAEYKRRELSEVSVDLDEADRDLPRIRVIKARASKSMQLYRKVNLPPLGRPSAYQMMSRTCPC